MLSISEGLLIQIVHTVTSTVILECNISFLKVRKG